MGGGSSEQNGQAPRLVRTRSRLGIGRGEAQLLKEVRAVGARVRGRGRWGGGRSSQGGRWDSAGAVQSHRRCATLWRGPAAARAAEELDWSSSGGGSGACALILVSGGGVESIDGGRVAQDHVLKGYPVGIVRVGVPGDF